MVLEDAVKTLAGVLRGDDPDHSEQFWSRLARRLVAHGKVVAGTLRGVEEPRVGGLQQQRTAEVDDQTWWLEAAAQAKRDYEDAVAQLKAMGSPYFDGFDPDARDGDREDDRLREQRQDEAARRERIA